MHLGEIALERRRLDAIDRERSEHQREPAERVAVAPEDRAAFGLHARGDVLESLPESARSSATSSAAMPAEPAFAFRGSRRTGARLLVFFAPFFAVAIVVRKLSQAEAAE